MIRYSKLLLPFFPFFAFSMGFSLNTVAQGDSANLMPIEIEQSQQIAGRTGKRRRGDCGIPPDVWSINFCESGHFCYMEPKSVTLWLPEEKRSGWRVDRVKIENTQTNQSVTKGWKASQATFPWPLDKLPIQSEGRYKITLKNSPEPFSQEIILHQIFAQSADEQIFEMKQKGCESQADRLSAQKS
jgi:hypothetical protein